jgi:hypothetical protein
MSILSISTMTSPMTSSREYRSKLNTTKWRVKAFKKIIYLIKNLKVILYRFKDKFRNTTFNQMWEILLHDFKSTYTKRWSKYFSIMTKILYPNQIMKHCLCSLVEVIFSLSLLIEIWKEERKKCWISFWLTNIWKHIFMLQCIREKVVSRFVNWKVSRIFIDDLRNFDFWMNERN